MATRTEHDRERNRIYFRHRYATDAAFRQRCLANTKRNASRRKVRSREWWQQIRSILRCELCGEDHPAVLDFHHKDAADKTKSLRTMVDSGYSQQRILAEAGKCTVLCSNCHRKLHWDERAVAATQSV